jgi:hypothetical protein
MTKSTKVVEIVFCDNCGCDKKFVGSTNFTNIGGFAFIFCETCGIADVESFN